MSSKVQNITVRVRCYLKYCKLDIKHGFSDSILDFIRYLNK